MIANWFKVFDPKCHCNVFYMKITEWFKSNSTIDSLMQTNECLNWNLESNNNHESFLNEQAYKDFNLTRIDCVNINNHHEHSKLGFTLDYHVSIMQLTCDTSNVKGLGEEMMIAKVKWKKMGMKTSMQIVRTNNLFRMLAFWCLQVFLWDKFNPNWNN